MKLKILYIVTQAEFGGAQKYIYDLAVNLRDDFEIAVAIGEIKGPDELIRRLENFNQQKKSPSYPPFEKGEDEKEGFIKIIRLKHLVREIAIWHDLAAVGEIKKLIKKEKPDVIHLNSTKAGFVGSLAVWFSRLKLGNIILLPDKIQTVESYRSRPKKIRLIYTIHGWIFLEPLAAWRKTLYFCLEKISARICDALIVLSESELQTGLNKKICKADKLHLIPHGIKPPEFLPKNDAREALQKISNFQFPISNLVIGTIANFYPTKGLPYLIEAAAKLKNKHNFQVAIIGDGIERAYLESLIVKYGLADKIFLPGQIPEAAKYLKAFDIFVLPSVKEGLPYAMMEAMAAGLPIVATRVGGIPEMIWDGQSGLTVPSKDPETLAATIEKLIDNPELRMALGTAAKADAEKKFGLERMLDETKKIYGL